MNTDLIVPILTLVVIVGLGVVSLAYNVADSLVRFQEWIDNERARAEIKRAARKRTKPAPLFAFYRYYVKPDDPAESDSSENPVLPGSEAIEPTSELVGTIPGSDEKTSSEALHNDVDDQVINYEGLIDTFVAQLATIQVPQFDGSMKYLTHETIAKIAGISKQRAGMLIRQARGLPEPDPKPAPYTFEKQGNSHRRIDK